VHFSTAECIEFEPRFRWSNFLHFFDTTLELYIFVCTTWGPRSTVGSPVDNILLAHNHKDLANSNALPCLLLYNTIVNGVDLLLHRTLLHDVRFTKIIINSSQFLSSCTTQQVSKVFIFSIYFATCIVHTYVVCSVYNNY